jgi:hypothetical protein
MKFCEDTQRCKPENCYGYACKTRTVGTILDHVHKATQVHCVAIEVGGGGSPCAIPGDKNEAIGSAAMQPEVSMILRWQVEGTHIPGLRLSPQSSGQSPSTRRAHVASFKLTLESCKM